MFHVFLGIISAFVVYITFFGVINHWLYRLNRRYDKIKEPTRLILAMSLILPGISVGSFADWLPGYWGLWGMLLGFAWLTTLLLIRMAYIHGILKET